MQLGHGQQKKKEKGKVFQLLSHLQYEMSPYELVNVIEGSARFCRYRLVHAAEFIKAGLECPTMGILCGRARQRSRAKCGVSN